jgi:hypothetical protein
MWVLLGKNRIFCIFSAGNLVFDNFMPWLIDMDKICLDTPIFLFILCE